MFDLTSKVARLKIWRNTVSPIPLSGGITNRNYLVEDNNEKFFVRTGEDIPLHQIMRFNELAASYAAAEAGLSPGLVYHEPGIIVFRFIDGKTLTVKDIQEPQTLERLLPVLSRCHRTIPKYLKGPVLAFWVFHVLRDYEKTIISGNGRLKAALHGLMETASKLEKAVGPIDIVFGHNDLLSSNFIDDGEKIWLIDWDYAGFNSPLFDLGGLSSNNELDEAQEIWLLENYFECPLREELWHRYSAMKCASLLRETLWSMVSEIHSSLDFDYVSYTDENLMRFNDTYQYVMKL